MIAIGCSSRAQQHEQSPPTPVRVEVALASDSAMPINVVGKLESATTARLAFKVGGPIARLTADAGDRVRAGQLLGILATNEIDAAVTQARAGLDKAERDAARMERLYRDSVVTLAQYQDAQTGLSVAKSAYESASFNREYAQIVAPADGRVLRRFAEPGELAAPGAPIFEIGYASGRIVTASLTDRDVVRVSLGDPVNIDFDAIPGESFDGSVTRIGEASDPRTGGFNVEITVARPDARLRSGFIAHVDIVPKEGTTMTTVTPEALVRADGRRGTVFVLDTTSATVRKRDVAIAGVGNERLVVASGLEPGERVVTDGAPYLTDGSRVSVVN